jgi:hypothetical protein
MGASAWSYWVPYRDDVDAALQALRRDVFERGEYYRATPQAPQSLEQLLERGGESGTHSIIDVASVAPAVTLGAVAPLPADEVAGLFGSERPTRADIETNFAGVMDVVEQRGRWTGSYLVAYRNGEPDELHFFGMSGD